jgi:hypothetical protein
MIYISRSNMNSNLPRYWNKKIIPHPFFPATEKKIGNFFPADFRSNSSPAIHFLWCLFLGYIKLLIQIFIPSTECFLAHWWSQKMRLCNQFVKIHWACEMELTTFVKYMTWSCGSWQRMQTGVNLWTYWHGASLLSTQDKKRCSPGT